jgi:metal-responsive CopG/Arc/MetJ family transcriptional regulator
MSKKTKREPSKQFSVNFPKTLLDEIDTICAANYMTRTSWLVGVARSKLTKERLEKINKLKEGSTNVED